MDIRTAIQRAERYMRRNCDAGRYGFVHAVEIRGAAVVLTTTEVGVGARHRAEFDVGDERLPVLSDSIIA